jgi:ribosome-associated heat shock protein Hsp15
MIEDDTELDAIRLDKWLWQARFFKTRALASKLCMSGRVRVDGVVVKKAHYGVRPGLVLTFPQARKIRVIRVLALGDRRGPASEAAMLYEEIVESP